MGSACTNPSSPMALASVVSGNRVKEAAKRRRCASCTDAPIVPHVGPSRSGALASWGVGAGEQGAARAKNATDCANPAGSRRRASRFERRPRGRGGRRRSTEHERKGVIIGKGIRSDAQLEADVGTGSSSLYTAGFGGRRGDAFSSGAPGGGSFDGWIAETDLSARLKWRRGYFVLSAGAGWLSASGVPLSEPTDGPKVQIGTLLVTGGAAQMFEVGPLLLGFGVEVLGTVDQGVAFSPALHLGLAL